MSNTLRTILIFGLVSGGLTIGMTIFWVNMEASSGPLGMPIGYLIMFLALSLIFVGVKQYRDVERGGVIKFVRASLVGLAITALASLVYIFVWEGYMASTDYAFISDMLASGIASLEGLELTDEERAKKIAELEQFRDLYELMPFRLAISLTEILPVGLVVSLLSALLLRNPNFLPSQK